MEHKDAEARLSELDFALFGSQPEVEALWSWLDQAEEELWRSNERAASAEERAAKAVEEFRLSDEFKKELLVMASHAMAQGFYHYKLQQAKKWPQYDISFLKPAFIEEEEEELESEESKDEDFQVPPTDPTLGEPLECAGCSDNLANTFLMEVANNIITELATEMANEPDDEPATGPSEITTEPSPPEVAIEHPSKEQAMMEPEVTEPPEPVEQVRAESETADGGCGVA